MAKLFENYSITKPNKDNIVGQVSAAVMKKRFLELYMQTAHIQKTCQILGLVPRTMYFWRQQDKQFAEDFAAAEMVALTVLEDEATRRAVYGNDKPVYQGGRLVGFVKEYSDQLMIVLLKARAPQKYKDLKSTELTGPNGEPLMKGMTINHVHSAIPIANSEDQIQIDTPPDAIEDIKHVDVDREQREINELLGD